jgi:hypothetical protein
MDALQEPCDDANANQHNSNALNALEGDAISRQAVLDELNKWEWQELYLPIHFKENIIDVVPSVNPQEPKSGKWIEERTYMECPSCHDIWHYEENQTERFKFCPTCGSKNGK